MNKALSFIDFGEIVEFRNGLNFSKDNHGIGCWLIGVADFKDNFTPKYNTLEEVNPEGITKEEDYLKKGDIIFVRSNGNKALVGRSLYIDRDVNALFSGFCIRARLVNDIIDPLFLAYYTRTDHFKSSIAFVAGTNINNLNQDILSNVKLPLYPKDVQLSITNVLSIIDKKIDLNNRINAELESIAKTLYDYWFVQFDFPNEKGKPYKSSGGNMVWNEKLKKEIPKGWEVNKISDLLPVLTGKEDANFATPAGRYPFFTCAETISYCDSFAFEGKAVLLAGNGNFNIKLYEGKFNAYQRTYVLIPKNEEHYTIVFYAVKDRIKSLTNGSRGSIVKFITKGDIEDITVVIPKSGFSNLLNALNTITKNIECNIEENMNLIALRDWLLPMLMNGQVKVN